MPLPEIVESARDALPFYGYWARHAPNAPALVAPDARLTFGELRERIGQEQRRLASMGRQRLLHTSQPNSAEAVITLLAGLNLGLEMIVPDQDWAAEQVPAYTADLLEHGASCPTIRTEQGGMWLFTSGTTEAPKPRFRSRALLRDDVEGLYERLPAGLKARRPASLCLLPLSHGFGLDNAVFLVHALGGCVLIDEIDNRAGIERLLGEHPVEMLYTTPTHLEALADEPLWQQARAPLTWCVSAAMRLPSALAERFSRATGCRVRQQFGTTETGSLCLDSDDPPDPRPHCMGRPVRGVKFKVLGKDGDPLGAGEEGELAVWRRRLSLPADELTADGYWPMGDHGYCDTQGRIHLLGRYKPFTDERGLVPEGV